MTLAKLPKVSYKPWTPDPRTEKAQARKVQGLSQPIPPALMPQTYNPFPAPQGRLPGVVGPMPEAQLPQMQGGAPAAMAPMGGAPTGQAAPGGRVPGFAGGGEIDVGDYGSQDDQLPDDFDMSRYQEAVARVQQALPSDFNPDLYRQALDRQQQGTQQGAQQPQQPQQPAGDMWQNLVQNTNAIAQAAPPGRPESTGVPQDANTPGVTQPNTLLGQLQQSRYNPNDPTAGNVAPDAASKLVGAAATALPMVAFGAPASAASLAIQDASNRANLPGPVKDVAALAPYMLGGIGELPTQSTNQGFLSGLLHGTGGAAETLSGRAAPGLGKIAAETVGSGLGQYLGNQADKALGTNDWPIVGGPGGLIGMGLGGAVGGAGFERVGERAAALAEARAPGERGGLFGGALPGLRTAMSDETGAVRIPGGGGEEKPGPASLSKAPGPDLTDAELSQRARTLNPNAPAGISDAIAAARSGAVPATPASAPDAQPGPDLTPHQQLLADSSSMTPQVLRQTARALGVDVEGAINRDQLVGRISQASRANDPITDAHLQQISKATGISLNSLRTNDPQYVLENALESRRGLSGSRNPSLSQGISRQASAAQKAIDAFFPDSGMSTQSVEQGIRDAYDARTKPAAPQTDLESQLAASLQGQRPENPLGKFDTKAQAREAGVLPGQENYASAPRPQAGPPTQVPGLDLNYDPEKYQISQLWARDQQNPDPAKLTLLQMGNGLYNAGLDSGLPDGTPRSQGRQIITDRYMAAHDAGIKLPQEEPPSGMEGFGARANGAGAGAPPPPGGAGGAPPPPPPGGEPPQVGGPGRGGPFSQDLRNQWDQAQAIGPDRPAWSPEREAFAKMGVNLDTAPLNQGLRNQLDQITQQRLMAEEDARAANPSLDDHLDSLAQRAQGATPGPFPQSGPQTPVEAARAAQAEIAALGEIRDRYSAMSDGELIQAAEAAGVKPEGTAPLVNGKLDPDYKNQLTGELTMAERRAATAENPAATPAGIGEQMSAQGQTTREGIAQSVADLRKTLPGAAPTPPEEGTPAAKVAELNQKFEDWRKMPGGKPGPAAERGEGLVDKNPRSGNLLGTTARILNEAGYFILGGDVGTVLRQDIGNTINPFKAAQTAQVAANTFRSFLSEKTANELMHQYGNLAGIKDNNVKMDWMDWRAGKSNLGRESAISKLTDWGPLQNLNRANAMWINTRRALQTESLIQHYSDMTPARAQSLANLTTRFTGRGDFGKANEAMSKVGPLFTSLRYMASVPQRAAYLIPWTKLADGSTEIMGPAWQQAVKDHAGWAAGTMLVMGMAKAAGLPVGMDPRKLTSSDDGPGFGKIRGGRTDYDITGGAGRYLASVVGLATGQKNGKDYPRIFGEASPEVRAMLGKQEVGQNPARYGGTVADFFRNSVGPGINLGVELAKLTQLAPKDETSGQILDYLHPDYWNKGPLGTGTPVDQFAGHLAFLWTQSTADALRQDGLKGALVTAPLELFGANATTIPPGNATLRQDVMDNALQKALPGRLGDLVKQSGDSYDNLTPYEKSQINLARDPAEVQRMSDQARAQGSVYQMKSDFDNAVTRKQNQGLDQMQRDLKNGKADSSALYDSYKQLNQQTYAAKQNMTLQGAPGFPVPQSEIQKAVAAYNNIYDAVPKLASGKVDYDRITAAQERFINTVKGQNPDLGERLQLNVARGVNENAHPLTQEYQALNMKGGPVDQFFSHVTPQDKGANAWRAQNPVQDAKLAYYGVVHDVRSVAAYNQFKQMNPDGTRVPNLTLDMGKQGTVARNQVPYAAREPIVEKYFSLPTAAERANWLQENPNVDAALWRWGYTTQLHSINSYQMSQSRR